MRVKLPSIVSLALAAPAVLAAQEEAGKAGPPNPLSVNVGLMLWTLVIFLLVMFVLGKWAFPKLLAAVEERERALQEAIDAAKRDREEAARQLEEHRRLVEGTRGDAQKVIQEAHAAADKMRNQMLEQAREQQQEMLERARREIEGEKAAAIADLRRAAVDLAIAGASKVIEKNLDDRSNRALVEGFLSTITPAAQR